jgi:hypothetical protein
MYLTETVGIITSARGAFDTLAAQDGNQSAWLTDMAAAFGKPHAITLRIGSTRFSKGQFTPAQDWPDFQPRLTATLQRLRENND